METKIKVTPKDFFLYLAITICLYFNVGSFLGLAFGIIDYRFPDVLTNYGYVDPYSSGIRFAIAALIVIYPLFFFLSGIEHKDIEKMPSKITIWVHRWAAYLNIFLSGATIAVTLIWLVNDFLGSDVTTSFVLKSFTTIVVAALIFFYYLSDIRKGTTFTAKQRQMYIAAGGALVLLAIILGFFIMGSPATQRNLRLDSQRESDLQSIQYQVTTYWQQHSALPATLASLQDSISGFSIPIDPENRVYEYSPTGTTTFQICATFDAVSVNIPGQSIQPSYPGGKQDNWNHSTGRTCFDRTIDPAVYPPYPKNSAIGQ